MKYIPNQRNREFVYYLRSQHILFDHPFQFFVLEELVPQALQRGGEKDKGIQIITWFIYGLEEAMYAFPEVLRDLQLICLKNSRTRKNTSVKMDSNGAKRNSQFCQCLSESTAGACHSLHATTSNDEKETDSRQGSTHPLVLGQWVVDHQILVAFGLARVGDVLQKQ